MKKKYIILLLIIILAGTFSGVATASAIPGIQPQYLKLNTLTAQTRETLVLEYNFLMEPNIDYYLTFNKVGSPVSKKSVYRPLTDDINGLYITGHTTVGIPDTLTGEYEFRFYGVERPQGSSLYENIFFLTTEDIGSILSDSANSAIVTCPYLNIAIPESMPMNDGRSQVLLFKTPPITINPSTSPAPAASTSPANASTLTATHAPVLTATPSADRVKLTWTPASHIINLSGYDIFRGSASGSYSSAPVTDFPVVGTSHMDVNVQKGNTYYYIVKPYYGTEKSHGPASNEVSVKVVGQSEGTILLQVGNRYMYAYGVSKEIDPGQGTAPVIVNGRTFLPIRAVIEALGGSIDYDSSERRVTIKLHGNSIEMWIGKNRAIVNGQEKLTDIAPFISETNRTMLPLRFVIDNLGLDTVWDGKLKQITIKTTLQTAEELVPASPVITGPTGPGGVVSNLPGSIVPVPASPVITGPTGPGGVVPDLPGSIVPDSGNSSSGTDTDDLIGTTGGGTNDGTNGSPATAAFNWTGHWTTSFGYLRLEQSGTHVTGYYDGGASTIDGNTSDNNLTGTWQEGGDSGKIKFTLSSDANSFTGQWCYDDDPEWTTWNGQRIVEMEE